MTAPRRRSTHSRTGMLFAAGFVALTLSGCAATTAEVAAPSEAAEVIQGLNEFASITPDADSVALLPADLAEAGEFTVVMNVGSAPTKFFADDNETIIGVNADIARLLGKTLGLTTTIADVQFDGIIPALQADRYDVAVSSMGVTDERTEVLDMIDYAHWGSSMLVAAGNPDDVSVDDLCGVTIAVQQGSLQQAITVPELSTDMCGTPDGIVQVVLPSQQDSITQLSSGRVQGVIADTPVLGYAVSQAPTRFELGGEINSAPVTIAAPKGSDFTPALEAAMQYILSLPEYQEVMAIWGMTDAAITETSLHS